jgi:hypothetical protein
MKMRNKILIAEHRGGLLTKNNHYRLIRWARECSERVLPLIGENVDRRLHYALLVAEEWKNEKIKTGIAIKASAAAHSVARESSDPISMAVARSIGHAVATAHMADHSPCAALYALKALKSAGKLIVQEREWQKKQLQQLPLEIADIVLSEINRKGKVLRII